MSPTDKGQQPIDKTILIGYLIKLNWNSHHLKLFSFGATTMTLNIYEYIDYKKILTDWRYRKW